MTAQKAADDAIEILKTATELHRNNNFKPALIEYESILTKYPSLQSVRENVGKCYIGLEEYAKAASNFLILTREKPDVLKYKSLLAYSLKYSTFQAPTPTIREALLICLQEPSIKHLWIYEIWVSFIHSAFDLDTPHLETLNDPLLLSGMSILICADEKLERNFRKIRATLLAKAINNEDLKSLNPLIRALAQQCFLTEYVYTVSGAEKQQLATLEADTEEKTLIHACYKRLTNLDVWKNYTCAEIIKEQAQDYETENKIKRDIKTLGSVSNSVSKDVQQMYEENPYPRWKNSALPVGQIIPYKLQNLQKNGTPLEILIAGCGTGLQIRSTIELFKEANITAFDLSASSLAYAIRKGSEIGYNNRINYLQMDILDVPLLDKKFDIIICTGVLHHMADPMAGWRALHSVCNPQGIMEIALYSEIARKKIVKIRERTKDYPATQEGIHRLRDDLMAAPDWDPKSIVGKTIDFYSTSGCRDLLLHIQEYRFTIPQIKQCLNDLSLEFLGFNFSNIKIPQTYKLRFPDDPEMINLDNWHIFETENTQIFDIMYQFNTRKIG